MANHSNNIPIRFYYEFWKRDFPNLAVLVQDHLGEFLEDLQTNPERPALLAKCQKAKNKEDHWVYFFCGEYAVYWHLVREVPRVYVELSSYKVVRIDILEIRVIPNK